MEGRGCKWFQILIQTLFCGCVVAVLLVSLPQRLLHWGGQLEKEDRLEKVSLNELLDKKQLKEEDYRLIFEQTGLGPQAVELYKNQDRGQIEKFQKAVFQKRKTICSGTNLFTRQDRSSSKDRENVPMVPVEDGDILITFSSHTLGYKHGHAAIVIDGKRGLCLEAIMPGCRSKTSAVENWKSYAGFAILRLKNGDSRTRAAVADFAARDLQGIPYSLLSGVADPGDDIAGCSAAQCAYLVWYAFSRFGYDLDGDGGRFVTVADLAKSPYLEVVQAFHIDAEKFSFERK